MDIRCTLQEVGQSLSDEAIARWQPVLATRLLREELQGRVAEVTPALESVPPFFNALLESQRQKTAKVLREDADKTMGNPMFKGFPLPDYLTCWQVFYYRFVNPEARTGKDLNYADRLREARAEVLPGEWVIYQCPARSVARAHRMR